MYKKPFYLILIIVLAGCQASKINTIPAQEDLPDQFLLGIDYFLRNNLDKVKNKRIGLLTNPSGVNADLVATSDIFYRHPDINLTTLFGPEHGIRGDAYAGSSITDTIDSFARLPIYSLYGNNRKPTQEMLKNVDIIVIDLQDIGLRPYTYIYTMALMMTAAKENGKSVIILDRPNPIGGKEVEGNLVAENYFSFVGMYPIPYRHGMTIGELGLLFNSEYHIDCELEVIPIQGWKRSMLWNDTGLCWVPTSPHVPHWETIFYMIATGPIGELQTLSVGVGYTSPFEIIAAPWIKSGSFCDKLNQLHLPGVVFRPITFKPYYGLYAREICEGVQLHVTDLTTFRPYVTGLELIHTYMQLYPEQKLFENEGRNLMFDKVIGSANIRNLLTQNVPVDQIKSSWQESLHVFKQIRSKYLLYK